MLHTVAVSQLPSSDEGLVKSGDMFEGYLAYMGTGEFSSPSFDGGRSGDSCLCRPGNEDPHRR